MDLEWQKVLVVGLARTGLATAKFLKAKGSIVTHDRGEAREEEMKGAAQEMEGMDISVGMGRPRDRDLSQTGSHCGEPRGGSEPSNRIQEALKKGFGSSARLSWLTISSTSRSSR